MSLPPWDAGFAYAATTNKMPHPDEICRRWQLTRREAALFGFGFLSRFRKRAEWVYRVPDPALDLLVYMVNFHAVATYEDGTLILDIEIPADLTRH